MSFARAVVAFGTVVFGLLLVETRRAARNERAQLARGGVEARRDVYELMRFAYPGAFLAMLAEGAWRGVVPPTAGAGVALFGLSKALKWWAITSLGPFWTFRVITIPGARLVASGPYRFLRHPNYVAVVGELISVAMVAGARVTGPAATIVFGALLLRRIIVEDRSLRAARSGATVGPDATRVRD